LKEKMKAARLRNFEKQLHMESVPIPQVGSRGVLVKIAGAGVCHSDLHLMEGAMPVLPLPMTLGHENAGYIEETGRDVPNLKKGDPVAVYGCWGCGLCRFCRLGEEQFCVAPVHCGITVDGGYAEYLHVPDYRHLIKLEGIDPVDASALTDAGLTPYRAIKKTLPFLYPGCTVVIIGIGGLGHLAVQIFKALSPSARVIAVDVAEDKLKMALDLGADYALDGQGNVVEKIGELTKGMGAQAVIDLVGSDSTLKIAGEAAGSRSIIVLVGAGSGLLPYSFAAYPHEVVVTGSNWGSFTELEELLALSATGMVRPIIQRFSLEEINHVFHLMEKGEILGRAVIVPDEKAD
jgi:propanol-preferring alcohol dehydrogenase